VKPSHDVVTELKGQVRVVFKHFPLDSIHPLARGAAVASLAAHRQGKFWPFHDLLFENIKSLKPSQLRDWARVVGLDMAQFEKDIKDPALAQQVRQDVLEASRAGVRGTPTLFLNGRRVLSSEFTTVDGLKKIIESTVLK